MLGVLTVFAAACSSQQPGEPDDPDITQKKEKGDVTLSLRVVLGESTATGDTRSMLTREGFNLDDDNTTEPPSSLFEKVRSLRVIIVRGSRFAPGESGSDDDIAAEGVIEHNRKVMVQPGDKVDHLTILNDNLDFLVSSGEQKWVYLFANEEAIADAFKDCVGTSLGDMIPGQIFPTEKVLAATFEREPDHAWMDNTQFRQDQDDEHTTKAGVPMTERFRINVPVPTFEIVDDKMEINFTQTETLFVIRDAVKFSFHLSTAAGFKPTSSPLRVDSIQISGIANKGYIMPRGVTYSPEKYMPSPTGERFIKDFDVPADAGSSNFNVVLTSIPDNSEYAPILKPGMDVTVQPYLYVPETKAAKDQITVSVKLSGGEDFHVPVPLGLDKIPRNTHVKINIIFGPNTVSVTADVVPYKEVWLKPDFGFDPFEVLYLNTYVEELKLNDTLQLNAWITPASVADQTITWTSSEERVATVNKDGLVTAIAVGITTITAHTDKGLQASCIVTVK